MSYPISTPAQLRTVLRSLRESRKLSQAELGKLIGVSQRRIAAIEAAPGRASFDQLSRLVAALGARVAIEEQPSTITQPTPKKASRRTSAEKADW